MWSRGPIISGAAAILVSSLVGINIVIWQTPASDTGIAVENSESILKNAESKSESARAPASEETNAIVHKWAPSVVQVNCIFKVPGIEKAGAGILYANGAKTTGLILINSNVALIRHEGALHSFDECQFTTAGGLAETISFNTQNMGMIEGANEQDGVFWVSLSALSRTNVVATVDHLCVHRPLAKDPVVLIGIKGEKIVSSKSSVISEVHTGMNYFLGPKYPPQPNFVAAIDERRNCFLGLVSRDQTMFLPFMRLANFRADDR